MWQTTLFQTAVIQGLGQPIEEVSMKQLTELSKVSHFDMVILAIC
jgi:hypothetical protein